MKHILAYKYGLTDLLTCSVLFQVLINKGKFLNVCSKYEFSLVAEDFLFLFHY